MVDLLSESHFAAVCCQWTPETDKLMNEEAFAAMKPDGVITNIARGEIIDENAMLAALDSGHLRGAAIDVKDHPALFAALQDWGVSDRFGISEV